MKIVAALAGVFVLGVLAFGLFMVAKSQEGVAAFAIYVGAFLAALAAAFLVWTVVSAIFDGRSGG